MLDKKIIILDTETLSIDKPVIYDLAFIVAELVNGVYEPIEKHHLILKQVYNNKILFNSAYYNEKRPKYTAMLRSRKSQLKYVGHAFNTLRNAIKVHDIEKIYAYNSSFDKRAIKYTAEFFKIRNIENVKFVDIQAIASIIHGTPEYQKFATENNAITNNGYLQTNAEITYSYITNTPDFVEDHIGIKDCEIELDILNYCIKQGYDNNMPVVKMFAPSNEEKTFKIVANNKSYEFKYKQKKTIKGVVHLIR